MDVLVSLKTEVQHANQQEDAYDKLGMEEPMYLAYLEGLILLAMNKPHLSLPKLLSIQEKNPYNYQLALNIAQIFLQRKKYDLAENQFIRALNIDDTPARAHHGLGLCFLRKGELNAAIEEFLIAIESDFFFHRAHYHLGEALVRQGLFEDACQAFEVNLRLTPNNLKAHKWLAEIYKTHLKKEAKAEEHSIELSQRLKGERIICTEAMEKNATSVLTFIQSLGHPIYDHATYREKADNLYLDASWLDEVTGQIIYIPSHSLSFLPDHFQYKLLYIQGEGDFSSTMKNGQSLPNVLSTPKLEYFNQERDKIERWIESQAKLPILYLNLDEMIQHKEEQELIINNFLTN
jgi:tetratricopeptide (TPR) repeat protein